MTFLSFFILLAQPVFAANNSSVEGYWRAPSGGIVHVHPCGGEICLRIVKLSSIIPEKVDAHNPDEKQRQRPLCGLEIGTGFRQADASHLTDGRLYDPQSGHTYAGTISTDGDEMKLRGYIGIALFGRTEIWKRAAPVDESACR